MNLVSTSTNQESTSTNPETNRAKVFLPVEHRRRISSCLTKVGKKRNPWTIIIILLCRSPMMIIMTKRRWHNLQLRTWINPLLKNQTQTIYFLYNNHPKDPALYSRTTARQWTSINNSLTWYHSKREKPKTSSTKSHHTWRIPED